MWRGCVRNIEIKSQVKPTGRQTILHEPQERFNLRLGNIDLLVHRIGGIEKQDGTGNISYDPANHEFMVRLREERILKIADKLPPLKVMGDDELCIINFKPSSSACVLAVVVTAHEGSFWVFFKSFLKEIG